MRHLANTYHLSKEAYLRKTPKNGKSRADVPNDHAIIRDLRMVKTVGFHRLRILIDRKQNPEACPGETLREPACSREKVDHGRHVE